MDAWVVHYNHERPHQGIGDRPPIDRFRLAERGPELEVIDGTDVDPPRVEHDEAPPEITRRVGSTGRISLAGFSYLAGHWLADEVVEVVTRDGVVEIFHRGALIITHARRHQPGKEPKLVAEPRARAPRPATAGVSVTRMVDGSGQVSFAGANYRIGNRYKRRQAQVTVVGNTVELSVDDEVVRTHVIRHDRSKEHGAFATPKGRPRKPRTA